MRFVDDQSRTLEGQRRPARLATHIAAHLPLAKHLADITLVASMLHDVGKKTIETSQDELAALGVQENLAGWRGMAAEIPALLAEA